MFDEFAAWLESKRAAEAENDDGDEEVEIWNEKGAGARVKKRDAKPFLQSLGLLPDPEPESTDTDNDKKDGSKSRPTGRTSQTAGAQQSTVRKYFTKPAGK
jgi:hypothetical protein